MKRYPVTEIETLHICGRTTVTDGSLNIFWTGSGIEFRTDAAELYIELSAGYEGFEPWIEIVIDGKLSQRRMLEQGRQKICVFRRMEQGPVRHVRILKATQAPGSDPESFLQIHALMADGTFLPMEPHRMKIEIIGDSITSCEGLGGALTEETWNASQFSFVGGYPYVLGQMLNADVHVLSQSGYGVYCSWRGNPRESLPPYYLQNCGLLHGKHNQRLGAHDPWDFAAWQPDWIIVNLGTNDSGSFDQAGKEFPEDHWRCPMRVNADGSMNEEDRQKVLQGVVDFLRLLRQKNPDAGIIWCYGMLPGRMTETLREAVECYSSQSADKRVTFVLLPRTEDGEYGGRSHPGLPAHRKAAEALFREINGWH